MIPKQVEFKSYEELLEMELEGNIRELVKFNKAKPVPYKLFSLIMSPDISLDSIGELKKTFAEADGFDLVTAMEFYKGIFDLLNELCED